MSKLRARIGLIYRNQSAKAEILSGPVGNKVRIGRGQGSQKEREGIPQPGQKGEERTSKRDGVKEIALIRAPRGLARRSPDMKK
jgi:hypothetical protein